jgi:hypothetical protein
MYFFLQQHIVSPEPFWPVTAVGWVSVIGIGFTVISGLYALFVIKMVKNPLLEEIRKTENRIGLPGHQSVKDVIDGIGIRLDNIVEERHRVEQSQGERVSRVETQIEDCLKENRVATDRVLKEVRDMRVDLGERLARVETKKDIER